MKRTFTNISGIRFYSSKFINSNFRIKLYGIVDGIKKNTLLGVTGALAILGDFLYKFVEKALMKGEDKCVFKLRRGITISLYCK